MFDVTRSKTGNTLQVDAGVSVPGWEQWFFLFSDAHWDNVHCNRPLLKKHLDRAMERNAGILSFGDWFCLMQGKADPRRNKSAIRPEHNNDQYFSSVVHTAADWLEPYKDNIIMMSDGNHETSVRKHHEVDVTNWLTRLVGVNGMGYSGFVDLRTKQPGNVGINTYTLYFHHGSGGGGIMTKGTLGVVRTAAWVPDAHFVVGGHIHEQWMMTHSRLRRTKNGNEYLDEQIHIKCPTYKQEFDMAGGYHTESGRPPKPLGGWWLRLYYDRSRTKHGRTNYEFIRAK